LESKKQHAFIAKSLSGHKGRERKKFLLKLKISALSFPAKLPYKRITT
jgi:hypothetical protein